MNAVSSVPFKRSILPAELSDRWKGRNMRKSSKAVAVIGGGLGVVVLGLGGVGHAQITGNLGTTSVSYGPALATQTINTGFGDSTIGDGTSTGGSELDAAYGVVSGGNLNVFLSGNLEDNGNHFNLFVHDGRPGQNVLALPATGTMATMNGSSFSPGFPATYALDLNDYHETDYVEEYAWTGPGTLTGGYAGSIPVPGGIGTGMATGGGNPAYATIGYNDTNAAGVNGNSGTAANPAAADAVNTGIEVSIPLSVLGNPAGPIMVLADINGGGDTYLSNQFLPGLPVGINDLGGGGPFTGPGSGTFNFANAPGEYFTVTVPEPASMSLLGGAVMMLCVRRRKA